MMPVPPGPLTEQISAYFRCTNDHNWILLKKKVFGEEGWKLVVSVLQPGFKLLQALLQVFLAQVDCQVAASAFVDAAGNIC